MTTETPGTTRLSDFGSYLRTQRKRAELTQRELAGLADVDFTYISKLENNAAPAPAIQTLRRMADALHVTDAQMCAAAGRLDSDLTKQELERYVVQLLAMHENYQAATNSHIARLTEALEWYANKGNYRLYPGSSYTGGPASPISGDNGDRARAALHNADDAPDAGDGETE